MMKKQTMPPLSPEEERIIAQKGTERPFSGEYWNFFEPGAYVCRRCGVPLYCSEDKFDSHCGWPSFDAEIPGAVRRAPDADGRRTEILCAACDAHLGHVFEGEALTPKNTRHCVNSLSMRFVPMLDDDAGACRAVVPEAAVFAGGCFWGLEHAFSQIPGVLEVTSGYTGGHLENPDYARVCEGSSGHAEAVRVEYDPRRVSYEQLARLFFEWHDPTQLNRQGPDVGHQYRSAIFYADDGQKRVADELVFKLQMNGYDVVTEVLPAATFYPAEEHHQKYLARNPWRSSCHARVPRFERPAS